MEEEFVPGNNWKKLIFITILILVTVSLVFIDDIVSYSVPENDDLFQPNLSQAMNSNLDNLLTLTIISSFVSVLVSLYLLRIGIKVKRAGRWPPPGMKMAFRTKIRKGRYAKFMSILILAAALMLILQPAANYYVWYSASKSHEEILNLLEENALRLQNFRTSELCR